MPTEEQLREAQSVLGTGERLVEVLHPHVLSFFRYFDVGVALLIWNVLLAYMLFLGPLKDLHTASWAGDASVMLPILLWAGLAALLGTVAVVRFRGAFRFLYWFAVLVGIVLGALMAFVYGSGENARAFAIAYGLLVSIVALFTAEVYRHAFTYYITDLRVVLRYKLFSSKETDLRFEKIEDWKISRSLSWRLFGIGTIRPYTGTEDGKVDLNRSFDSPDECLFGIKDPERVRRDLVDLILSHDRARYAPAPEPAPRRTEPEPRVAYYKPAPQGAVPKAPAHGGATTSKRNYERIAPPASHASAPETEDEGAEEESEEEKDTEGARGWVTDDVEKDDGGTEEEEGGREMPSPRSPRRPHAPAPPAPEEDDRIDPAAGAYRRPTPERQPRRMFPQAAEGSSEPQLSDTREMKFEAGPEDERPRVRRGQLPADDDLKPRGL